MLKLVSGRFHFLFPHFLTENRLEPRTGNRPDIGWKHRQSQILNIGKNERTFTKFENDA